MLALWRLLTRTPPRWTVSPRSAFSRAPAALRTIATRASAPLSVRTPQHRGSMTSRSGSRALATEATPVSTINNVSSGDFTRQEVELDGGRKMPFYVYNKRIDKPLLDKREYRLIRLENELEALLICDTETDKASAAMDVRVGHLSDPPSLQGMAHFCEHLLFMGTKKYPRENLSLIHI